MRSRQEYRRLIALPPFRLGYGPDSGLAICVDGNLFSAVVPLCMLLSDLQC
jgi:hypothetical protein